MASPSLCIATRKSPLALWQANHVKAALTALHPQLRIEILGLLTEGDKQLATSLATIGGKGLFVKELELAILERRADIAVHSIKDMPVTSTDRLQLVAVCQREDPRDVLVSNHYANLNALPQGAVVGTSSSRRTCLLRRLRPDLQVENLRGNVGTRLQKLDAGHYDAIILAAAGLNRLNQSHRISEYLNPDFWIPAVGQGAIGIECHEENNEVQQWLLALDDKPSRVCITAERAFNRALGGSCQLPIAAYATYTTDQLHIRGFVAHPRSAAFVDGSLTGTVDKPVELGAALADLLLQRGARVILEDMAITPSLSYSPPLKKWG